MSAIDIRRATPEDATTIHDFIVQLAIYEREPDAVEATPESLRAQLAFDQPPFRALIASVSGLDVGFALWFPTFSTWTGQVGIHLEDLFVQEDQRGSGAGRALLAELARLTVEGGGRRLEWQVLDWNQPSIDFYESIGAEIKRDWLPCRVSGATLDRLAGHAPEA